MTIRASDTPITIDMARPLECTWLQLQQAMYPLHLNNPGDVTRLHDVWLYGGVPSPSYRVALPGEQFDERNPRPGDHLVHLVMPTALATWIEEMSAKRGFPYSAQQAMNITQGKVSI